MNICFDYQSGNCRRGDACPYKHTITNRSSVQNEVCKYWLRGLCKMGADCEYMHVYETSKIPECFYYQGFGECSNPECVFRHVSLDDEVPECQAYRRGFCKYGPKCRLKHLALEACPNFMAGLCIDGSKCAMGHPSNLYVTEEFIGQKMDKGEGVVEINMRPRGFRPDFHCYVCSKPGHSVSYCGRNMARVREVKEEIMKKCQEPDGVGCYHCKGDDHSSAECPLKKTRYLQHRHKDDSDQTAGALPGQSGRADLIKEERDRPRCHRCNEEGHVLRDCPLAKAERSSGKGPGAMGNNANVTVWLFGVFFLFFCSLTTRSLFALFFYPPHPRLQTIKPHPTRLRHSATHAASRATLPTTAPTATTTGGTTTTTTGNATTTARTATRPPRVRCPRTSRATRLPAPRASRARARTRAPVAACRRRPCSTTRVARRRAAP